MAFIKKCDKISPAPDWGAIFKKRPDLEPPGYTEAARLHPKERPFTPKGGTIQ